MALIECPECKSRVSDQADSCPSCGHPVKPRSKDLPGHGIPALFSFFVPGLGQLIKGDYLAAVIPWICFYLTVRFISDVSFLVLALIAIWIDQVIDTYRVGTWWQRVFKRNEALNRKITAVPLVIIACCIAAAVAIMTSGRTSNRDHLQFDTLPERIPPSSSLVPLPDSTSESLGPQSSGDQSVISESSLKLAPSRYDTGRQDQQQNDYHDADPLHWETVSFINGEGSIVSCQSKNNKTCTVDVERKGFVKLPNAVAGIKVDWKAKPLTIVDVRGTAASAGVRNGDILIELDGYKIVEPLSIFILMGKKQPGDHLKVTVLREGRTLDFTYTTMSKTMELSSAGAPSKRLQSY